MSFYISLSGLKAAQTDLSVVANNVANVSSGAFKKSRASFGDIYASTGPQGVRQVGTTQQFTQGTLETTDKTLDLAITGEGFFAVKSAPPANQVSFTRNGAFGVNANGYVEDKLGNKVQLLPVDAYGKLTSTDANAMFDLRVPTDNGKAIAPSAFLPGSARINDASGFVSISFANGTTRELTPAVKLPRENNDTPTKPYTAGSATIDTATGVVSVKYDDGAIVALSPPVKVPPYKVDASGATPVNVPLSSVTVSDAGVVTPVYGSLTPVPLTETVTIPPTHNTPSPFLWAGVDDTGNVTAYFADGSTKPVTQMQIPGDDGGTPAAQLSAIGISIDGVVTATFANGDSLNLGMLALGNFANPEGLNQSGDGHWTQSNDSGEVIFGAGNNGRFGAVRSGTLERSNVDITEELVALISAQRNFQANAKAIETASTMTQAIVNLRT